MKTPFARLLAPIAALAAALFFVPAALAAPAATTLTLSGPGKAPGGTTTLTARLTAAGKPLAGKGIALYGDGAPAPLTSGSTDSGGRIAFEVTVTAPTKFQAGYAPSAADAAAYAPATSKALQVAPAVGIRLSAVSRLRVRGRPVTLPRIRVPVRGTIARHTPGQRVTIDVFRGKRRVLHRSAGVARAGSRGTFSFSFEPRRTGVHRLRASLPGGSVTVRVRVLRPRARRGSGGPAVRALQWRLRQLGYVTPVNGRFGDSTARAVLAFRKVNRYARTTGASATVFRKLARGGGGFHLRYPRAGKHVEFDWSRQVLVLARGGKAVRILHASSGKSSTPTVFGRFRFYSKTPGYNSVGMYYSSYFIGGYAIHGYASVPTYAASHGCIRIPIPSATSVYRWIRLGDPIYVYR